ncbi:MAG: hypothetical protein JWO20_549 [Candidatus Angelobacter sp.]|jgi:hypothetical protein|nr:hypothetical protein [Candidatus Angelobacter sp.]
MNAGVEVSVRPNKLSYRLGEFIFLTVQLKNTSTTPVYVHPAFGLGLDGNGVFHVYAKALGVCPNEQGYGGFVEYVAADEKLTFAEYVESHWLLLQPGQFIGQTYTVAYRDAPKCTGKYKLTVRYYNKVGGWSMDRINATKAKLKYPFVSGLFEGSPVPITIRRQPLKSRFND